MTFPSGLTTITVNIDFTGMAGLADSGTVSFAPPVDVLFPGSAVLSRTPQVATLSAGVASIQLITTDNTTLNPSSWGYTVTIALAGLTYAYQYTGVGIPSTYGSSVNLATVLPPSTPTPITPNTYGVLAQPNTWLGANTFDGPVTFADPITGNGITDWFNVKVYGATGNGTTDDTTAVQAAITAASSAGGGTVYLPAGAYKTSAALTLASHVTVVGAGSGVSVISQASTTAAGVVGTDLTNVGLSGLSINGPGSGSGIGVNLGLSVNSDTTYLDFTDIRVASFGSHGIEIQSPVTCRFDRVLVSSNGGDGWHIYGSGTSCHWNACYSLSNASGIGYHLIGLSYSGLSGCAADSNADGYSLSGCTSLALTGCGTESNVTDGFILSGGSGNSLTSCFVYANARYGVHVTSSEVDATLTGFTDHGPAGGAVAGVLTDSGTTATVINRAVTTADTYNGTVYQVTPYGASGQMWAPEDNGLVVAVGDPWITQGTATLIAGTLYLVKLVIRRSMTVSNLWWLVNSAGSGASTGSYTGLYSSGGTLLSGSADVASHLTATGPQEMALTTPQALTAGEFVWAALLVNLATTQPGLHSGDSSVSQPNVNLAAASYRFATNGTGLTSLPATITPTANSQTAALSVWAGGS